MTDEFNTDDMDELANNASDAASDLTDKGKDALDDLASSASDTASDLSDKAEKAFGDIKNTIDGALTPSESIDNFDKASLTGDDKLWAMLSWLFWPIVPLIVLFLINDRPFARYHAMTSLVVGLIFSIISGATFGIGCFLFFVSLYYAAKAWGGNYVQVPLITSFLKGQGWV